MQRLAGAIAVIALLGAISPAVADEATGTIKFIDQGGNEVTLNDGSRFVAASDKVELSAFTIGEKVKVTYTIRDGRMIATKIWPAV